MKRKIMPDESAEGFWFPLDNAAKIYPAITNDELTSVFRISVILKKEVDIENLKKSVIRIDSRFPYYNVKLKKGFFWYYFESADFQTPVIIDDKAPCRGFDLKGCLHRVLYSKNKISIEFSHMLCDGSGAFEYLKTLLAIYFESSGVKIPESFDYLKPDSTPDPEETEDAYNRYFQEDIPKIVRRPKAFHLPFPIKRIHHFDTLYLVIPIKEIKAKAKEKGVNVTIYLTAVYFHVLQEIFENLSKSQKSVQSKKLSIEVPINLRNLYKTSTLRNFTLFVMPDIDLRLGHYTFDQILKSVYHQMQLETDEKLINKILALHVGSERKFYIRGIPLFIKSFVLRATYFAMGSSQYSGVLTNMGGITFPEELGNEIDYLSVSPPPPDKIVKVCCGIIGSNDKLAICFGNISKSKELEQRFVKFLTDQGISIKITK